jgi:hypothetical protein
VPFPRSAQLPQKAGPSADATTTRARKCRMSGEAARRPTSSLDQADEIVIFGQHNGIRLASGLENDGICCVAQLQVSDGDGGHFESLVKPACQRRGELSVNPQRHAATIG